MGKKRKDSNRIRDQASGHTNRSQLPQTAEAVHPDTRPHPRSTQDLPSTLNSPLTSTSILPPDPNLLIIRNPLPPTNLPSHRGDYVTEAISSVSPGTVNVVGHDQINNVTNVTHIHMNPGAGELPHTSQDYCRRFNTLTQNKTLVNPSVTQRGCWCVALDLAIFSSMTLPQDPLFNKLSHVAEASFDASTPASRRACTEKTRTIMIEAIKAWSTDATKPNIYWMNGMAGTGKTTIAYSLSIILTTLNILGSTFFCSRLVDECTKVDRIFPTIAYNLARKYPPLASTILKALIKNPDIAKRTISQQFTELILNPMRASAKDLAGQTIVVVIDALDECANQTEVQTFLSIIFQRSSEFPLKIFITSRPEQLVRVGFNRQNPDSYSKFILHDIERDIVNADIKLYAVERLVDIVDGRSDFQDSGDDWPPGDKVNVLVRRSNRLFIYAKTVCDYIGEPGGNISERLDVAILPREEPEKGTGDTLDTSELDKLYRDILDRAIPKRASEHDRLKMVLSAIISIRNPLSARGLGTLLETDPSSIKSTLGSLHSVISVPQSLDAPVSTFHASFPDCLTEPTRSHQHFLPSSTSHEMLAKRCLSVMNSSLKENICDLRGYPSNKTIANKTITAHIFEGLAYAYVYWVSHLTASGKDEIQNSEDVHELLDDFLCEHILHWMECLSLLKQLHVAIESLQMMEGWILVSGSFSITQ
jgi:hypothetical protein